METRTKGRQIVYSLCRAFFMIAIMGTYSLFIHGGTLSFETLPLVMGTYMAAFVVAFTVSWFFTTELVDQISAAYFPTALPLKTARFLRTVLRAFIQVPIMTIWGACFAGVSGADFAHYFITTLVLSIPVNICASYFVVTPLVDQIVFPKVAALIFAEERTVGETAEEELL